MLRTLALLALLASAPLAGCNTPPADDAQPASPAATAGASAGPIVFDVVEAQQGDRACYLTARDEAGTEQTLMAAFEVCETDWAGRRVRAAYEEADVMAESCQGDPACTETERVDLVVALEPVTP